MNRRTMIYLHLFWSAANNLAALGAAWYIIAVGNGQAAPLIVVNMIFSSLSIVAIYSIIRRTTS